MIFLILWEYLADLDQWASQEQMDDQGIQALKEERVWQVPLVLMGNQVCQVCQVKRVLQASLRCQEVRLCPIWLQGSMMGSWEPQHWSLDHRVNQAQEDIQDQQVHQAPLEHKEPQEMQEIPDRWVLMVQGAQMDLLESPVQMVNPDLRERLGKLGFQALWGSEDFQDYQVNQE